jgi:hypothetical protein
MKVRDVPRGRRKPNDRLNPEHLAFIRKLPCVSCGIKFNTEAAHVRIGSDGGMALKPSDRHAVPLCTRCHALQHRGERTFWLNLGNDPIVLAASLWASSGDVLAGERIVIHARFITRLLAP